MKKILFAALATVALTGVASAREVVTVKLEQPKQEATRVIADGNVWNCAGDTCQTFTRKPVTARTCGLLAREVGRVSAYNGERQQLSAEQLATCNARARSPQTYQVQR
jgi:uncharacterized membrane protein